MHDRSTEPGSPLSDINSAAQLYSINRSAIAPNEVNTSVAALQVSDLVVQRSRRWVRSIDENRLRMPDPEKDPKWWERQGAWYLRQLLRAEGLQLEHSIDTAAVVWLRGLSPDLAPGPAPYSGYAPPATFAATLFKVFGVIGLMRASACAFLDENDGRIVRHVVAVPAAERAVSSHGWSADLPWHMDGAYRPFQDNDPTLLTPPPRWLIFGVIKADPTVPMTVALVNAVTERLSPRSLAILKRPDFAVTTPDSVEQNRTFTSLPILDQDEKGNLISRYNKGHCLGLTTRAADALHDFETVLNLPDVPLVLPVQSGDLVVIDNWRCLHRRPAYTPTWTGKDRWFVRAYATARPLGLNSRQLP
ncbi:MULTISPECIES: TauD/TfdA family dioxygenase [unclassified Sphingomonas]|jgi:L-asparagine oxygenase|uniref:TauD/TfdA family dioxygenase n=1 Tax=unclassified Sphingomonas TaxID=196159 RepID=UPI0009DDD4BB|nr:MULTISPECIES: TauD/TfdA family dioxygenase [unclassified Sphingomonas]